MKVTNKKFAHEFLQMSKDIVEEVSKIDPNSPVANTQLAIAQMKNDAIKQANNTFRSCLQHDVAKAKMESYQSSFLDED